MPDLSKLKQYKQPARITIKIFEYLVIFGLLMLLLVTFVPTIPLAGGASIYTVLSGSMEPAIKTGSVIISKPIDIDEIKEGDIITFKHPDIKDTHVTHRVIRIEEEEHEIEVNDETKTETIKTFVTKGDANDNEDAGKIHSNDIKGKYVYQIPFLGYVSDFVKSRNGFILIIVLPCLAIILSELWSIKNTIQEHYKRKLEEEVKKAERNNKNKSKQKKKSNLKKARRVKSEE